MRIIVPMAIASAGATIKMITAREAFIINAMITAPISIPGARSIIRSPIIITFCICVMSFVSLVTSEPALNPSILAKENCCTFRNRSPRKSLPKCIAAFTAK